jgi:hypothetical protein
MTKLLINPKQSERPVSQIPEGGARPETDHNTRSYNRAQARNPKNLCDCTSTTLLAIPLIKKQQNRLELLHGWTNRFFDIKENIVIFGPLKYKYL